MGNKFKKYVLLCLTTVLILSGCGGISPADSTLSAQRTEQFQRIMENVAESIGREEETKLKNGQTEIGTWNGEETLPAYTGSPYCVVNDNIPYFTDTEKTTDAFENYSDLDSLGRCGVAYANICKELMPTEKRGDIGMIKPTGWHTVRYDDLIKDKYLYNRCHLIGFQLAGENANEKNLVTGTRYMNVDGMLPFENMVADYVKETNNHVLYRVTPLFAGDDLVCRGVEMEAYSVEDHGEGVTFHVFVYNVQPGIEIDYATGDSWVAGDIVNPAVSESTVETVVEETVAENETTDYILNVKTGKFHRPDCSAVAKIAEQNREERKTDRQTLIAEGYTACGICKP